jgi:large subunit ribosomal protein L3
MKAILGKKIGMTQIIAEDKVVPVTVLHMGPCVIVDKKTPGRDGYRSVQLGYEDIVSRKLTKPVLGHYQKQGVVPKRHLREVRIEEGDTLDSYEVGGEVKVDLFSPGDLVSVTGVSKGKGFQGVMKRHGFHGGPASHGAGQWHRRPGSIGASADPSRVFKGKKMPGRMGKEKVTVKNLLVVDVNVEDNLLLVRGSCPGNNGSVVMVRQVEA